MARKKRLLPPIHPGEILKSGLLEPLGLSINKLARCASAAISAPPRFWLELQSAYDLETAERETLGEIERDVRPRPRMAA